TMFVIAMPLKAVMLSHADTTAAREVKGEVPRRGLCGDVFLGSEPAGSRIGDCRVETWVRKGEITVDAGLEQLDAQSKYFFRAVVTDHGQRVREFRSPLFRGADLQEGRFAFHQKWLPARLWDLNTPGNVLDLQLTLLDAGGGLLDVKPP